MEVLTAFWAEMAHDRALLHRQYPWRHCDIELHVAGQRFGPGRGSGAGTPAGFRLGGSCPCRDVVLDAFLIMWLYLAEHGTELHNPAGAIRTHLRLRLVEVDRAQRKDKGAQTKPATVRGNRYARALPDDLHREVLVMVVDEAGRRTPLGGELDLVRRLAQRCAAKFGGNPADHLARLPEVLATIEGVCRTGPRVDVGTDGEHHLVSWWEAYVVLPLGRRPNPYDAPLWPDLESDGSLGDEVTARHGERIDEPATDDDTVVTTLTEIGTLPEHDRDAALQNGITDLERRGVLPSARAKLLRSRPELRRVVIDAIEPLVGPIRQRSMCTT